MIGTTRVVSSIAIVSGMALVLHEDKVIYEGPAKSALDLAATKPGAIAVVTPIAKQRLDAAIAKGLKR